MDASAIIRSQRADNIKSMFSLFRRRNDQVLVNLVVAELAACDSLFDPEDNVAERLLAHLKTSDLTGVQIAELMTAIHANIEKHNEQLPAPMQVPAPVQAHAAPILPAPMQVPAPAQAHGAPIIPAPMQVPAPVQTHAAPIHPAIPNHAQGLAPDEDIFWNLTIGKWEQELFNRQFRKHVCARAGCCEQEPGQDLSFEDFVSHINKLQAQFRQIKGRRHIRDAQHQCR